MSDKIRSILKKFVIRSTVIFIVWMVAYHGFIGPNGKADEWLTTKVVQSTKIGLTLLGYDTTPRKGDSEKGDNSRFVYIDGQPVVLVDDPCNGLELVALFIGFLLCFPGPLRYKAVIIPVGSSIVFLINVIREVVLALNYKYFQQTFDFNHKYTYVFFVYLAIFLMWRFWLNQYSSIGKRIAHEN
ncbi:MAG: archaeosortase/exosortase family protein [Cyclobacteriaceae bacterium]